MITVELGRRMPLRVVILREDGTPARSAKKDTIIFVCAPGLGSMKRIPRSEYDWRSLGEGFYELLLPADCFQSLDVGSYAVIIEGCHVWRDNYQVVRSSNQKTAK